VTPRTGRPRGGGNSHLGRKRRAEAKAAPVSIHDQIMALAPTNDLMLAAWIGCVHYALGEPAIVAQYRLATGSNWLPPSSPIERMIDEATGAEGAFLVEFIKFVNKEIWGKVNGRACNGDEAESPL